MTHNPESSIKVKCFDGVYLIWSDNMDHGDVWYGIENVTSQELQRTLDDLLAQFPDTAIEFKLPHWSEHKQKIQIESILNRKRDTAVEV